MYFCPSVSYPSGTLRWTADLTPATATQTKEVRGAASYAMSRVHRDPGPPTPPGGEVTTFTTLSQLTSPSETFALLEIQSSGSNTFYYDGLTADTLTLAPEAEGKFPLAAAGTRHLDGYNFLYWDGHVKWLPPTKATDTSGGGADGSPWSIE